MKVILDDFLGDVKSSAEENLAALGEKLRNICMYDPSQGGRSVYTKIPSGIWVPRPLRVAAVTAQQRLEEAADITQQQLESLICDYCQVEHVLRGMMLEPGVYSINGEDWLAAADLPMWRYARGLGNGVHPLPDGVYAKAITYILGEDGARRLFAWLAGARDRIIEWRDCLQISHDLPALAIIGRQGCGKTLILKQILPRVLGAAGMDFSRRLAGETGFSGHVETTPLLTIDDSRGEAGFKARKIATKVLKQVLYGQGVEIHLKNHEPICIKLPHCMVFCANEDASSLRALPVLSREDEHKMLILKAVGELEDNKTTEQKRKWNEDFANEEELQGFIDYIDDFGKEREKHKDDGAQKTPLWNERQYLNGGCFDADLRKKIESVNPAGAVADAVLAAVSHARMAKEARLDGLRLSDIVRLIANFATHEEGRNFQIAFPTDADKREGLEDWLQVKGIPAKYSSDLHANVYNLTSIQYDY